MMVMISIARKNLPSLLLKNPNSNAHLFLSINCFFSTSRAKKSNLNPEIYDVFFQKHQFSSEFASSLHLTKSATPERADSVLSFLKENSFTNAQLEKIVRYDAGILGYDVEGLQLKLNIFRDLGLSSEEIAKMMVGHTTILHLSVPNSIVPSISILKGLLGFNDEVARLVRKCEWFITSDLDKTLMPNVQILKSSGMPMERVRHFLFVFPRAFFIKPDVMRKSVDKAIQFGVTRTSIAFMVAVQIFSYMSQEMLEVKLQFFCDSVLSFLKENSFTNAQLEKIVRYDAGILGYDVECLQLTLSIFRDLGLSSEEVAKMMVGHVSILHSSVPNRIIPSISILKGLLGSDQDVARLLRKSAWFLKSSDLNNTLLPNIEILKSSGLPMERVLHFLHLIPRILLIKPDIMKKSVDKAIEFGVPQASAAFIHAVCVFAHTTQEMWEAKLQTLRDLGFSDVEILTMFRSQPNVFSQSQNKLKSAVELLVGTGKYNISNIVTNPASLGCSIEKRLEPRLKILGLLESKNLIERRPSLAVLCRYNDGWFSDQFVKPYFDEEYITKK